MSTKWSSERSHDDPQFILWLLVVLFVIGICCALPVLVGAAE